MSVDPLEFSKQNFKSDLNFFDIPNTFPSPFQSASQKRGPKDKLDYERSSYLYISLFFLSLLKIIFCCLYSDLILVLKILCFHLNLNGNCYFYNFLRKVFLKFLFEHPIFDDARKLLFSAILCCYPQNCPYQIFFMRSLSTAQKKIVWNSISNITFLTAG